ncbi:hypothetical protein AB0L63_06430 [Nocardia sp. NPDC051990]|uniref:hypothetical protein n=1 Tax=Nocardia sp. NPDC051990 TaxID=3155285 RepID=UPI00343E6937
MTHTTTTPLLQNEGIGRLMSDTAESEQEPPMPGKSQTPAARGESSNRENRPNSAMEAFVAHRNLRVEHRPSLSPPFPCLFGEAGRVARGSMASSHVQMRISTYEHFLLRLIRERMVVGVGIR